MFSPFRQQGVVPPKLNSISPQTFGYDYVLAECDRRREEDRIRDVMGHVARVDLPSFEREGWFEEGVSSSGVDHGQLKRAIIASDRSREDIDSIGDFYDEAHVKDVRLAREYLQTIPPDRQRIIEEYVYANNTKLFDSQERQATSAGQKWFDWLVSTPREWVNPNADQRVIDLMEWNVEHIARIQSSPEFSDAAAIGKIQFEYDVKHEIDRGLHGEAAEAVLEQVAKTTVYVGDPFDITLGPGILGYYTYGTDFVTVCPTMLTTPQDAADALPETLGHELRHRIATEGQADLVYRRETWAEHFTAAQKARDYDQLDPSKRKFDTGVYVDYRRVSAVMYSEAPYAPDGIDVKLGMRALFGAASDHTRRDDALDDGWGHIDIQGRVQHRLDIWQTKMQKDRPDLSRHDMIAEACDQVVAELRIYADRRSGRLFPDIGDTL